MCENQRKKKGGYHIPQKLSAMKYIKNNKRRAAVLVVSLGLCFVVSYLTQFLLSATEESFGSVYLELTKKIQFVNLTDSTLGIEPESVPKEDMTWLYLQKIQEVVEKLKNHDQIREVYYAQILLADLTPPIAHMTYIMPLMDKEGIPLLMEHAGAALSRGRLPEHAGEIVMDEASMKNNGYSLNGYFKSESYGTAYQIVGVLSCENYFGCGIPTEEIPRPYMMIVHSEGVDDLAAELAEEGIEVREGVDSVMDYNWGARVLREDVRNIIEQSTNVIFTGILVLLSIALLIVYAMYLRDRREEWCLYSSIGYSRRTIYFSILRELLFTFAAALLLGIVIIVISQLILDAVLISPQGLKCRYFHPETIGKLICAYTMVLGILQIPVRYALYKVRTVDAIEDELY